jgi:hypothetical protein
MVRWWVLVHCGPSAPNTPTEGRPVQWALLVLWWQASLTDSLAYTVGGPTCTVVGPPTVLACLSHSTG